MNQELNFEAAISRLEEIVLALESGKCSLEESMKLFDEGTKLAGFCSETLRDAQQKIVQLTTAQTEE